jgi:hypothetical protein
LSDDVNLSKLIFQFEIQQTSTPPHAHKRKVGIASHGIFLSLYQITISIISIKYSCLPKQASHPWNGKNEMMCSKNKLYVSCEQSSQGKVETSNYG